MHTKSGTIVSWENGERLLERKRKKSYRKKWGLRRRVRGNLEKKRDNIPKVT